MSAVVPLLSYCRDVSSSQASIFDCLVQCPHTSLFIGVLFGVPWMSCEIPLHKEMYVHKMSLVCNREV